MIADLLHGVNVENLTIHIQPATTNAGSYEIVIYHHEIEIDRSGPRSGWGLDALTKSPPDFMKFNGATFVYANVTMHYREVLWAAAWFAAAAHVEQLIIPQTKDMIFERLTIDNDRAMGRAGYVAGQMGLSMPENEMPYAFFRGYKTGCLDHWEHTQNQQQ